jgi:hypothetical protein
MAYFVQIDKTLADSQYTVKISLKEITANDRALIDKYGAPVVNFGGSFTGPPAFTLPDLNRNLETGLPVVQVFDGVADVQAESKANVWEAENIAKMTTALTTLRGNSDSFTSSTEQQL